jgi:hypothetical protein
MRSLVPELVFRFDGNENLLQKKEKRKKKKICYRSLLVEIPPESLD